MSTATAPEAVQGEDLGALVARLRDALAHLDRRRAVAHPRNRDKHRLTSSSTS